jgi:hypothetical protein
MKNYILTLIGYVIASALLILISSSFGFEIAVLIALAGIFVNTLDK